MGTLNIIYAILVHIQGEAHPLYRIEQREGRLNPKLNRLRFLQQAWYPFLFLFFLLAALIFSSQQPSFTLRYGNSFLLIFAVCDVLSLGWTVPVAIQAGQSVSREHSARTLDLLLIIPDTTENILLTKAAASTRYVWTHALGIAILVFLLRLSLVLVLIVLTGNRTTALTVLLLVGCLLMALVEPLQEMALAVVIGLWAALSTESSRLSTFIGMGGGLLIRFVQMLVILLLVPLFKPQMLLFNPVVNTAVGSVVLLVAAPTLVGLLVLGLLIAGREALIYALFAWTVRRAHQN